HLEETIIEETAYLGVDLPGIKPFKSTTRSKKPVKNPESRLVRSWYKNQENLMIIEVLKTYHDPEVPGKGRCEELIREKEGLKQEKNAEPGPEVDLVNLIDSYLKIVDTWISQLGRLEDPESQSETNKPKEIGIRNAKHEANEPHQELTKVNPEDDETKDLEKEEEKPSIKHSNGHVKPGWKRLKTLKMLPASLKRAEEFRRTIMNKNPYELKKPERHKIADDPQELNVTNSPQTEEKVCTPRSKNKKKPIENYLLQAQKKKNRKERSWKALARKEISRHSNNKLTILFHEAPTSDPMRPVNFIPGRYKLSQKVLIMQ
ncbi:20897_t:CDS:2, partial [Dentiscutata erythropus]